MITSEFPINKKDKEIDFIENFEEFKNEMFDNKNIKIPDLSLIWIPNDNYRNSFILSVWDAKNHGIFINSESNYSYNYINISRYGYKIVENPEPWMLGLVELCRKNREKFIKQDD